VTTTYHTGRALAITAGLVSTLGALAMLLAAPGARYIGFEQDAGNYGGEVGITRRAVPTVLAGFNAEVRYGDSADVYTVTDAVDLFHVDGDHSYDGTMRDLALAWECSQFVLVDDYDYIRPVQAAVDHFIVTQRLVHPACQAVTDGGFRGGMLLFGRRHPAFAPRFSRPKDVR
jgi:hypothetical protein